MMPTYAYFTLIKVAPSPAILICILSLNTPYTWVPYVKGRLYVELNRTHGC